MAKKKRMLTGIRSADGTDRIPDKVWKELVRKGALRKDKKRKV